MCEQYVFKQEAVVAPSVGGSRKATTFTTVTEEPASKLDQSRNSFLPLLVVSIRGSKGKVDHMVNANCRPRKLGLEIGTLHVTEEAHSGFLSGAEVLEPFISKHLQSASQRNIKHVLFAGHSAGGAVASLLYLKYLSRWDKECLFKRHGATRCLRSSVLREAKMKSRCLDTIFVHHFRQSSYDAPTSIIARSSNPCRRWSPTEHH